MDCKKNVLYQDAGTDYSPPAPNAEYAEVAKIQKKPSTSCNEYVEVQKPNDVYAQVDIKSQQKNLKAKKQKGEVLKLILICIYVYIYKWAGWATLLVYFIWVWATFFW